MLCLAAGYHNALFALVESLALSLFQRSVLPTYQAQQNFALSQSNPETTTQASPSRQQFAQELL